MLIFFETLFSTTEMWLCYERCSSSKIPRNFIEVVHLMIFLLIVNIGSFKRILSFWRDLWKNVYFVFSSFNASLLALNQTAILFSSRFTLLKNYLMLLWDEKGFASSANIIGCRIVETLWRSLRWMMKNSEPKIDPCGTPHVISRWLVLDIFMFYILLSSWEVNCKP